MHIQTEEQQGVVAGKPDPEVDLSSRVASRQPCEVRDSLVDPCSKWCLSIRLDGQVNLAYDSDSTCDRKHKLRG